MCVLATQSCLPLCDAMDCGPRGSSVHGSLQARIWSGLPFPSPEDLPDMGNKSWSPALQADSLLSEPPEKPILTNIQFKFLYFKKYTYYINILQLLISIYLFIIYLYMHSLATSCKELTHWKRP